MSMQPRGTLAACSKWCFSRLLHLLMVHPSCKFTCKLRTYLSIDKPTMKLVHSQIDESVKEPVIGSGSAFNAKAVSDSGFGMDN